VEQDERDTGLRHILNFGHTIGHALESVSNFELSHGEAVGLGMLAASKISIKLDIFNRGDLPRLTKLLERAGLPVKLPDLKIEPLLQAIQHDKKITGGKIVFVLVEGIDTAVISYEVNLSLVEQVLTNWDETT